MSRHEEEYIAELQRHATETRALLSNAQKPERERMVVRAFLRCIGEPFSDSEIRASKDEPVDVAFRTARFQVMDILGGRKRGKDWRERERRYENARGVSELSEPWTQSKQMSFEEVSQVITEKLAEKASHYGARNCSALDALAYVDLKGRHLWPLDFALNDEVANNLGEQGWRSVSMLFVPYGAVLITQPGATSFLQDKVGLILNSWPHCDGWFDA